MDNVVLLRPVPDPVEELELNDEETDLDGLQALNFHEIDGFLEKISPFFPCPARLVHIGGLCRGNVLACYTHVHALGTASWAPSLVEAAVRFRSNV